jgi:hypothetical protein
MSACKLLCYELNEVPWRVIDFYISHKPHSFLAHNINQFKQITTFTRDSGELHPWSTWPTIHRGVTNDKHKIHFINQDLSIADDYPPIWDILAQSGISVGIVGLLQSHPPQSHPNIKFHIPDTFAANAQTIPTKYEAFQKINLMMTGENKATQSKIRLRDSIYIANLLKSGVSLKSCFLIAQQLLNEVTNPNSKSLRPMIQAYLAFDVLKDCLKHHNPSFVSFFTNHVAGIMHRYWKYSFPEDFDELGQDDNFSKFHSQSILKAMDIADEQIHWLYQFCQRNDYELLILSSMGQEAVNRGDYIPELKLVHLSALLKLIDFKPKVIVNLAMHPDIAFEFESGEDLTIFLSSVNQLTDRDGNPVLKLRYSPIGETLNLSICSSKSLVEDQCLYFKNSKVSLSDAGFETFSRDQGTGYHQPEGIVLWHGRHAPDLPRRMVIDSCQVLPTILELYNFPREQYMMSSIFQKQFDSAVCQ